LLFLAAVAAGALNAVVGGGSFISFPALIFTGVPPIEANATNTAALWPGLVVSAGAYRRELSATRRLMPPLILMALVGGLLGALALLHTPQKTFLRLVPWFLLLATLLFAFSGRINRWIRGRQPHGHGPPPQRAKNGLAGDPGPGGKALVLMSVAQLAISAYVGYFGAGIGILMLAWFGVMGVGGIHEMNGLRTLLVSVSNSVALITFILAGIVLWPQASLMIAGAMLGGYAGAYYARKMDPKLVRGLAILVGATMTAYFFIRAPH